MAFFHADCIKCSGTGIVVTAVETNAGMHVGLFCKSCEGLGMRLRPIRDIHKFKLYRYRRPRPNVTEIRLPLAEQLMYGKPYLSAQEFEQLCPAPSIHAGV